MKLRGRNTGHAGEHTVLLPFRTGGLPRAVRVMRVRTPLLVDLEERAAGVLRMQLHVAEVVRLELVHDAHAELGNACAARCMIVALRDHHVATVAAAASYDPADRYVLFELRPTEVRCNGYGDVELPEHRRWRESG